MGTAWLWLGVFIVPLVLMVVIVLWRDRRRGGRSGSLDGDHRLQGEANALAYSARYEREDGGI